MNQEFPLTSCLVIFLSRVSLFGFSKNGCTECMLFQTVGGTFTFLSKWTHSSSICWDLGSGLQVYKSSILNGDLRFLFGGNKTGFLYPDHYLRVCYQPRNVLSRGFHQSWLNCSGWPVTIMPLSAGGGAAHPVCSFCKLFYPLSRSKCKSTGSKPPSEHTVNLCNFMAKC